MKQSEFTINLGLAMGAVPIGGFTPLVVTPGTNQNMVFSGPNMPGLINSKPTGSLFFWLQNSMINIILSSPFYLHTLNLLNVLHFSIHFTQARIAIKQT